MSELRVIQVTDVHLVSASGDTLLGVDTEASFRAVLRHALADGPPDVLLATGDIAHDPEPHVYARFLDIVREHFAGPLLCTPGNHDHGHAMVTAGLPMTAVEAGNWILLALDSHEDDKPSARVDPGIVVEVAAQLSGSTAENALLATHHPLVSIDSPWLDKDRIQNAQSLIESLAVGPRGGRTAGPRLRAVLSGHAHQVIETSIFAGDQGIPGDKREEVALLGCPSTCFQFAERSQSFAVNNKAPGYRVLWLSQDGSVASEVRRAEDFTIDAQVPSRP